MCMKRRFNMTIKEAFEYLTTYCVRKSKDGKTMELYIDDINKYDEACYVIERELGLNEQKINK